MVELKEKGFDIPLKEQIYYAIPWFRKKQWQSFLEISEDRDRLESTYEEWLMNAVENVRKKKEGGFYLVKIDVDVKNLEKWCKAKKRSINNQACQDYAGEELRRPHEKSFSLNMGFYRVGRLINKTIRHPAILVLLAAFLTSWLIPYFNSISDRKKVLYEKRLTKAIDLVNKNWEFNGKFNSLHTTLHMFHRDNLASHLKKDDIKQEQKKLRERMTFLYLELDQSIWFWYWNIQQEAVILEIVSKKELEHIEKNLIDYKDNLIQCTDIVRKLWAACLSDTYDPYDHKVTELIDSTRIELLQMMSLRNTIMGKIVRIFSYD